MNLDTGDGNPITVDKDIPDLGKPRLGRFVQQTVDGRRKWADHQPSNGIHATTERLIILWPQIAVFTPEVE